MAAKIPTLFIPNTRGTDNQAARALWAADNKMALTVDQSNLLEIKENASKLALASIRNELTNNCAKLEKVTGALDVANIFKELVNKPAKTDEQISVTLFKLKLQDVFGRGWRGTVYSLLQGLTLIYRWFKPHKDVEVTHTQVVKVYEIDKADELRKLIKSGNPFEHLIIGASESYKSRRIEIASKAYLK
mgnify:CR=1 FL=1